MESVSKQCGQCGADFQVSEEDLAFYKEISPVFAGKKFFIPAPKMCPSCRHQRRLSFRNERKLYTRKCDLTGRDILSIYSPDKPYKVYDQPEWWSDKWSALDYGRDFDFSRNFAEQFRELYEAVPRISMHTINAENSYYTCYTLNMKNCYLIFGAGNCEDCMYGKFIAYSKDCLDSLSLYSSNFCYEGTASDGCYGCRFFINCRNCAESTMIEDCIGCKNCIACFGLRSKEHHILNKFVGKEKYEEWAKDYEYLTQEKIDDLRKKLEDLKKDLPKISSHIYGCEDCTGDAIFNSKNCESCFDIKDSEDCKFLYNGPKCVKTQDSVYCAPDGLQFCYNVCSTVGSNIITTYFVWFSDAIYYSMDCVNSKNLFGCVGLKQKQYCIFNKQYSKEDYEPLVAKIIEHMQKTEEWGEYFPYKLSPCAYNETVAMEYFPLKKEEILAIGANYKELEDDRVSAKESFMPPADIREVGDDICQKILRCEVTGRQYKILPAELNFYRRMKLPIPRRHSDQRHYDRLKIHGAYKLSEANCSVCGKQIETALEDQKICCEDCYLKQVY